MIVAIHQPQFLPWLGYFNKMAMADAFCYLDNVQYKKNEWQNRNRIKTSNGWQWLTVPVTYRFPQTINEVGINNKVNWKRKHLQALISNYKKAPFYNEYFGFLEEIYTHDWQSISELNLFLIEAIRKWLNLDPKKAVRASELVLSDDPTGRLIDICEALGGDTYLAGQDGVNYMDLDQFRERGVKVVIQDFSHPSYPQLFGEFQSHMSIVDLLFNCGPESVHKLRKGIA